MFIALRRHEPCLGLELSGTTVGFAQGWRYASPVADMSERLDMRLLSGHHWFTPLEHRLACGLYAAANPHLGLGDDVR
jgi:hypothetical protein